jgi:hypothetical protein
MPGIIMMLYEFIASSEEVLYSSRTGGRDGGGWIGREGRWWWGIVRVDVEGFEDKKMYLDQQTTSITIAILPTLSTDEESICSRSQKYHSLVSASIPIPPFNVVTNLRTAFLTRRRHLCCLRAGIFLASLPNMPQ